MSIRALGIALAICLLACNGKKDTPDGSLACPSRSGYFPCGGDICSRAIQVCNAANDLDGPQCVWVGDTALLGGNSLVAFPPECASCPTCGCLKASPLALVTCTDDGAGGLTFSLSNGYDGDPCKADTDCASSLCQNGSCTCLLAGMPASSAEGITCCSDRVQNDVCGAAVGHGCKVGSGDCYGGTCASDAGPYGFCTCVGAPGACFEDSDCCGGATQCVSDQCQ